MLRTTFLTLLFWVGLVAIPSCNRYPCNCPDIPEKYIDIEGVSGDIAKKSTTGPIAVQVGDKLSWSELVSFYARYKTRKYDYQSPAELLPSFGMAAHACDCPTPGYLGTQEKLKYMTVETVYAFDATHPAGSVINDLVSMKIFPNPIPLNDYFSKGPTPYGGDSLEFILTKSPANKGPFALGITAELDNRESYTAQTPLIDLI